MQTMFNDFINISKAFSDSNRVRAFLALRDRELCICQLTEFLKLAPSTVSKHMSILKQAGLVKSRKEKQWAYYSHADMKKNELLKTTFHWVFTLIGESDETKKDEKSLKTLLSCSLEELCRKAPQK